MKQIIYLLDGLSPYLLSHYNNKKKNFIDRLSQKSIFFENCFGYGETYSTTYEMFSGNDIYKNYCDAWDMPTSFKEKSKLADYFKSNGYKTIYYRNAEPNASLGGFYRRYLNSITSSFDFKMLKKKHANDNLEKFLRSSKIDKSFFSNNDLFILIHDFTFHDDPRSYNGTLSDALLAYEEASFEVKKNLEILNYNEKKDILYFLSDHGLTTYPFNRIHFERLEKKIYDQYYFHSFKDNKIKHIFFIKLPEQIKINIKKKIKPGIVFKIIKKILKNKKINLKSFIERVTRNKIIISLRDVQCPIYGFSFTKKLFHPHWLFIGKTKKIFSKDYPNAFLEEMNDEFIPINKKIFGERNINYLSKYFSKKKLLFKFINIYLVNLVVLRTLSFLKKKFI